MKMDGGKEGGMDGDEKGLRRAEDDSWMDR